MISSFLEEVLAQLTERSLRRKTLAYFFCDDKNEGRRTATAILRGLLLQILRQNPALFKYIQPDFQVSRDRLFTDFQALWRIFVSIVETGEAGEIFCLIDALDECEMESRRLFLAKFKKLFDSQRSKETFVKFIITSRRQNDIEESLSARNPVIRVLQVDSGRVNRDLSKFINAKVDELSTRKNYPANLKEKVKRGLKEKAGGTFLYVSLILDDLSREKVLSSVEKKLQELPSDLNKLYDKILSQIESDYMEIARSVLLWVAVARRPLKKRELAIARFFESGGREENTPASNDRLNMLEDGYKCCGPLIYINKVNNTINLVHQSAKEYLLGAYLQANNDLSQCYISLDMANLRIFRTCWIYLSLEAFKHGTVVIERGVDGRLSKNNISQEFLSNHCFLRYASQEWLEHAVAASSVLATDYEFKKDILNQLPTLRDRWLLRTAAKGQEVIVQRLLEKDAKLETQDQERRTPLSWAAKDGHAEVVRLLLNKRAKLETQDKVGRTPLSWAAESGHAEVVRLLLEWGAKLDSQDDWGRTPLSWAAENGYAEEVRLLLKKGAKETLLSRAVWNGHDAMVDLLKEHASGKRKLSLSFEERK